MGSALAWLGSRGLLQGGVACALQFDVHVKRLCFPTLTTSLKPRFLSSLCVVAALNVHTLATMHGNREEEMAAMLFWQYLAACITMPAFLSFYLWLLGTPVMAV